MSPTSTCNKKRKAEDNLHDGDDRNGRPAPALRSDAKKPAPPADDDGLHLPPPVWGHVLDYMPYEEVRSALLLCKMMANEAVKYVHTLNIMKVHQLDGPAARRFQNVEEVNCFSLISTDEFGEENSICARTATRLVPFLVTIPNLKLVYAGGRFDRMRLFLLSPDEYSDLDEQEATMLRSLVLAFLGALQGGLFPHLERIAGITEALDIHCSELCEGRYTDTEDFCSFCRDVCTYYPVKDLLENAYFGANFGHCGEDAVDIYELIANERPNSEAVFRAATERIFCEFTLETHLESWSVTDENTEGEKLLEKVRTHNQACTVDRETRINQGGGAKYMYIYYMRKTGLSVVDRMIALGFDPRCIPKDRLSRSLNLEGQSGFGCSNTFAKSTVDALISRGFNLDPKDLIILDEEIEPALKKELPDLIRK